MSEVEDFDRPSSVSSGSVLLVKYVGNIVHDEIVQRDAAFRQRDVALLILTFFSSS
jgi:hypothetical protein